MNPELPPQMSDIPNEGYVKYQTQRVPKHLPEFSLFNFLNKIRTRLYNKKLIGLYPNGIGFGNISIRYRDESFIISGTATGDDIFVMGGHDEGIIAYGKDLFTTYCLIKNLYKKAILGVK